MKTVTKKTFTLDRSEVEKAVLKEFKSRLVNSELLSEKDLSINGYFDDDGILIDLSAELTIIQEKDDN
jgi:hypothetical protein